MQLTFINDEVSRDLDVAIGFAREQRLSAVELRMLGEDNVIDLPRSELEQVKRKLDDAGLEVAAISTPLFKCPLPHRSGAELAAGDPFRAGSASFEDHLALVPRAVEVADFLGTDIIRVFAFLGRGRFEDVREQIVELLGRAGEAVTAARPNARLCVENEHTTYVRTAAEVGALLDDLGGPFDILWDPGNAYYAGDRSARLGFGLIADRVRHIHVKDPRQDGEEMRFVPLGQGEVDYPEQIIAWREAGYRGFVSLEPHIIVGQSSVEGARACLDYLRGQGVGRED